MPQTTTTQAAQTPTFSSGQNQSAEASKPKGNSEFEMFLKMLTVQMKNQDPLNPIESADYAVQLATFSGVEQQIKTNDLLKSINGGLAADGLNTLSSWIGREVPAPGKVRFSGDPVSLEISVPAQATRTQIEVYDSSDQIVQRISVPAGTDRYDWRGIATDGTTMPAGDYRFRTISWQDTRPLAQTDTLAFQRVTEVRATADGGELVLASGNSVKASEVKALRQAR